MQSLLFYIGQVEEWEKFQNDLLTSVRVANDFKTEAQQDLQRMILENKSLREKERQLKSEIEKLKGKVLFIKRRFVKCNLFSHRFHYLAFFLGSRYSGRAASDP